MKINEKIKNFNLEYQKTGQLASLESEYLRNYYQIQTKRYQTLFSVINKYYTVNQELLDIGVFPGYFSYSLSKLGYNLKALDLRPDRIEDFIKKQVDIKKCDIETDKIPYSDNSFNGVILAALLEHLRINPLFSLREIRRVLKPDGCFLLQTPNMSWWKNRIRVLLNRSYDATPYFAFSLLENEGHTGHVRVYNMAEVKEILENTGFVVKDSFYLNNGDIVDKISVMNLPFSSFKKQLYLVAKK